MSHEDVTRELIATLVPEDKRAALFAKLDGLDVSEATPVGAGGFEQKDERVTYDATGNRIAEVKDESGTWTVVEDEDSDPEAVETVVETPADPDEPTDTRPSLGD